MKNDQGAAQSTLPVIQADLELLARIHESGGNNAAAFTLRQVGAVGCVLEGQAQLIAAHRIEHSTPDRNAGEIGWLIEAVVQGAAAPKWWHPERGWLEDATDALRFARKVDAVTYYETHYIPNAIATEHIWFSALTTTQEPTP